MIDQEQCHNIFVHNLHESYCDVSTAPKNQTFGYILPALQTPQYIKLSYFNNTLVLAMFASIDLAYTVFILAISLKVIKPLYMHTKSPTNA